MPLTGRFNFRRTLTGRIVLQVEEDQPVWWSRKGKTRRLYRDANVMDLAKPEMRALIDLRNKPQFVKAVSRSPEPSPRSNPTRLTSRSSGSRLTQMADPRVASPPTEP